MTIFDDIPSLFWPITVLSSATVFTLFWILDSQTHQKLVKIDITDKELQTHRSILTASLLMEISLVLAYWFGYAMLPFFIAFFITRTVHEFIDELHFHTDRCTAYEANLHLGMWVSVLIKTAALFIWAFMLRYDGILNLPTVLYIWAGLIVLCMSYISYKEWKL